MVDHHCYTCLMACIDFRLREGLDAFLRSTGLDRKMTAFIRVAGGARSLVRPSDPSQRASIASLSVSLGR